MSRSGYSDDCENIGMWRGAVERAIRGVWGQALLREMADALDAMPVKELAAGVVVQDSAHVCALGSVALARGLDVSGLDIYDREAVSRTFGVAPALAAEIAYQNDEAGPWKGETPSERWQRMRTWVAEQLIVTSVTGSKGDADG